MVEVSSDNYQFVHGRAPRGEGSWAFYMGRNPEPVWFNGMFGAARRMAQAEAQRRGVAYVVVGA